MGSIWLKDGRQLTYREYGDPDGAPVLFIHGFSDSSTLRHYDDAYTATLGARIIAPDLPGIRGSSYDPQRTLLRWADDAIELVDALGLERFALVAISSGCSHASALASKLPDRVTRLSFAAPTGRYDRPGMESYVVADELKAILWLNRWGLAFLLRPIYALSEVTRQKRIRISSARKQLSVIPVTPKPCWKVLNSLQFSLKNFLRVRGRWRRTLIQMTPFLVQCAPLGASELSRWSTDG